MYKLSEVCRKIGVTRRTLQGYNELGLVKPSAKTEAGIGYMMKNQLESLRSFRFL